MTKRGMKIAVSMIAQWAEDGDSERVDAALRVLSATEPGYAGGRTGIERESNEFRAIRGMVVTEMRRKGRTSKVLQILA